MSSVCAFVYQKDSNQCQKLATNLCKENNTRYCLEHYRLTQKKLSAEQQAVERRERDENAKKARLYDELVMQRSGIDNATSASTSTTTTTTTALVELALLRGIEDFCILTVFRYGSFVQPLQ